MSGVGPVVGFLFTFAIVASVVTFSFLSVSENTNERLEDIETTYEIIKLQKESFEIDEPYLNSGRIKMKLSNTGSSDLLLQETLDDCINIFVNGDFVSADNYDYYIENPIGNYYLLQPGEEAYIEIIVDLNQSIENTIDLAKQHQVQIGAHPSFPDRENFGRKILQMDNQELLDSLLHQI